MKSKPSKGKPSAARPRVLIVEDDAFVLETMKTFLESWYEVSVARTAEEAVAACQKRPPSIVLMDLMMPGSSGYEGDGAIRRLISEPSTARIPIIIQTGFTGGRALNLKALGASVKDVLTKPVDLNVLKKKIESILARK